MKTKRLIDKTVLITGASSGIGRLMALEAAKEGAIPLLLARSEFKLQELVREIKERYSIQSDYYLVDLSSPEEIERAVQLILENYDVDVLINNAGYAIFNEIEAVSFREMESMFQVNVFGLIQLTQAIIPHLKNKKSGHIIFIASQAGKVSTPKASIYAATKHAVLGFSNAIRLELRTTCIKVSTVLPGPINTTFLDRADLSGKYKANVSSVILDGEVVAKKTISLLFNYQRELNLPWWMGAGSKIYQLFPAIIEKIAGDKLSSK